MGHSGSDICTLDGPKWTAPSGGGGVGVKMNGGQGEQGITLQTALNGRPGAEEAIGGAEVKGGGGVNNFHSRRP